jgi:hypothetical protein
MARARCLCSCDDRALSDVPLEECPWGEDGYLKVSLIPKDEPKQPAATRYQLSGSSIPPLLLFPKEAEDSNVKLAAAGDRARWEVADDRAY